MCHHQVSSNNNRRTTYCLPTLAIAPRTSTIQQQQSIALFTGTLLVLLLLLLLLSQAPSDVDAEFFKIKFNLQFMCGRHGAEGRVHVRARKSSKLKNKLLGPYLPLLDAVIGRNQNGTFNKEVVVLLDNNLSHLEGFDVFFRTNCYVINRVGECCAHDFKFAAGIRTQKFVDPDGWLESNFQKDFLLDPSWRKGLDCTFTLATRHPATQAVRIDLRDVLLNAGQLADKWLTYKPKMRLFDPSPFPVLMSKRVCSPRDDTMRRGGILTDADDKLLEKWPICAHPNYGLVQDSYAGEEQAVWQLVNVPKCCLKGSNCTQCFWKGHGKDCLNPSST